MEDCNIKLQQLKSHEWDKSNVSFYIVKRKLIKRKAKYEVMQVNVDDNLRGKLSNILTDKINSINNIREYDFNTSDLDSDVLEISTSETDMESIIKTLCSAQDLPQVSNFEDLVGSWCYIARFDLNGQPPLFAVRYLSQAWAAKKVKQLISLVFKDSMLIDLGQKEVFRIDDNLDFLSFNGAIFIFNKSNFEKVLNFREGMMNDRDEIVKEFVKLDLFENASVISDLVGNNMRLLRKLSQVKRSGYYKDPSFLEKLQKVNEEENWGIEYSESGKVLVTEKDIETVLRVFNNDRLTSKINNENFDVDVKHKI